MARNEEQNQKMRDERRAQILSTAHKLFALNGLGATKITDIARESKFSQGLLYHYFSSKEEIFVELVRHAVCRMNEAARALEKLPLSPKEKITKAITELLRGISENEDFARYFLLTAQANFSEAIPQEAKDLIRRESSEPYEVIARILRAGQKDGSIAQDDPHELAVVFWVLMKGFALHRASRGVDFATPDIGILTGIFCSNKGKP